MINISDKSKCSGCYACASVCPKKCIEMLSDEEGFYYPEVDRTNCIECGMCEKTCPIMHKNKAANTATAYAVVNKEDSIREKSSSGGFFSLIAENILDKGGVVFGAAFDVNFNVKHKAIQTKEELPQLRGSKYVQSNIGNAYKEAKELLENDIWVFFTGTPCQIEGLLSFLKKDYKKLITQDIICHGVPSPKVWQEYLRVREKADGLKPEMVYFRDKSFGWKRFSMKFEYNDQSYTKTLDLDPMMRAFLTNSCLRYSCYNCAFKTVERPSDFTIADYWGVVKMHPELDDDKGVSLVLINSKKAQELFKEISHKTLFFKTDIAAAIKHNPSIKTSAKMPKHRKVFLRKINSQNFQRMVKKYCGETLKGKIYNIIVRASKLFKTNKT